MNATDVIELLAYYRAVYPGLPMPSSPNDDLAIPVWIAELEPIEEPEDVRTAMRTLGKSASFPPSIFAIAAEAREIQAARPPKRPELEGTEPELPACCVAAGNSLGHWLETHATPAELETARKVGIAKALGGEAIPDRP